MAYSQSQNRATQRYVESHYDRLYITVEKGQKEKIKSAAVQCGESVNGFIKKAIETRLSSL